LIKEMIRADGSVSTSKLDPLRKLEEGIQTIRKSQEKDLFKLDQSSILSFSLPGKPDYASVLPKQSRKKALTRRIKTIEISSDVPKGTLNKAEYDFLPAAIGLVSLDDMYDNIAPPVQEAIQTICPVSDLEEITNIMSRIHTGEDAINFFARFGSDTPVL
jgi:hypothetical protein